MTAGRPGADGGRSPPRRGGGHLAPLRDKLSQGVDILVINGQIGVHAKTADLAADVKSLPFAARHDRHGLFLLGRGGRSFKGGGHHRGSFRRATSTGAAALPVPWLGLAGGVALRLGRDLGLENLQIHLVRFLVVR